MQHIDQQEKGMSRKRGGKCELSICLCHVSSHKLLLLLSLVSQPENGKCPFAQSHPELIRGWAVATHLGPQSLSCAPQDSPGLSLGISKPTPGAAASMQCSMANLLHTGTFLSCSTSMTLRHGALQKAKKEFKKQLPSLTRLCYFHHRKMESTDPI